jgi:hypothetical protein
MAHTRVWVTTQFTGFHHWAEAPDILDFLRQIHRHVFHIKLWIDATEDRQYEFFMVKEVVANSIARTNQDQSCERLAHDIWSQTKDYYHASGLTITGGCTVSEDGENGADYLDDGE